MGSQGETVAPQGFSLGILLIKRAYFSTDFLLETRYIDPIILKIVPLMVLPAVVKQLQAYRCLFFDKNRENVPRKSIGSPNSKAEPLSKDNTNFTEPTSNDCRFFNS